MKITQTYKKNIDRNGCIIGGSGESLKLRGFSIEEFMPEYAPKFAEFCYQHNENGSGIIFMSYKIHPDNPLFELPILKDDNGSYIEFCRNGCSKRFMCIPEKDFNLSKLEETVCFVYREFYGEKFVILF